MKIAILTAGSRGDVQPYIALAHGLSRAGHEVTLATGINFEAFVRSYGVNFAPLRADYYQLMDSPEGRDLKSGNPVRVMKQMRTIIFPLMRRLLDDAWLAAKDSELIIYHPKVFATPHIVEKTGVPCFSASPLPIMTPTRAFPAPGITARNLGGSLNKLTYSLIGAATSSFGGLLGDWRETTLKLPRKSSRVNNFTIDGALIPALYAFSSHVVPVPDDYPPTAHVTGYWFLEPLERWEPDRDLLQFLNDGAPPIYIGFGSMVGEDPEQLTDTVIEAVERSGCRAILSSGWGGLKERSLPTSMFQVRDVPHDWLFPRMAAVVHHGGAGTVAAGLRAGKPTLICPFLADQPFWGKRLQELGVGPEPIPAGKLTAEKLAADIRMVTDDMAMKSRAQALGERIRAEDGVAAAVDIINQVAQARPETAQRAVSV